jgi:phage tail protein X
MNTLTEEIIPSLNFTLYSVEKMVSLKNGSVSLFYLLLLISIPLLSLTARGYSSSNLYNEGNQKEDVHIVVLKEEGGSLYFLALKHYQRANETLFDLILQANPTITDVRQIGDEQKIALPVITSEAYVQKVSDGNYRVHVGTFESPEMANLYSDKVSELGKVLIWESHKFSPQDTWYRLMLSFFKSKEEALKIVSLLSAHNIIYIPPEGLP